MVGYTASRESNEDFGEIKTYGVYRNIQGYVCEVLFAFLQPSKFVSAPDSCRGFCQGKSIFSLMYVGKLLPRRNCLNNIHVNLDKLL